jgi:hypothetical protein
MLARALPVALVALSLSIAGGAIGPPGADGLKLTALIELQGAWYGQRWLALLQPIALLPWLACMVPQSLGPQDRATFAWQATALNRDLLTTALLFGGWQGPFAEYAGWLGLLYTAIKVALLTFVWTWAQASVPGSSVETDVQTVWMLWIPLAALNLVITSVLVAVR